MLDAPDLVRLHRLLGRGDAFDRIGITADAPQVTQITSFATLGLPDASTIFDADAEATVIEWLQRGVVTPDEARAKLQIVLEERRNYDPLTTLAALRADAPATTLYIDTVLNPPAAVARQVLAWLDSQQ
jgi:hypothetical protein